MGNTNLQLIFIEDFNQIDWKKFCKSLKEKGKNILNIFFFPPSKKNNFQGLNKLVVSQRRLTLYRWLMRQ